MKMFIISILLSLIGCASVDAKRADISCRLGDHKRYYCGNESGQAYAKSNIFDKGSRFIQGVSEE